MKNLLTIMLAVWLAGNVFAADAANDLILSQRKPDNSGNIQRNVPATGAITSGSLPSFLTALGLGTGDSPTFTGMTLSGLTSTRVVYAGVGGALSNSASLTFNSGTGELSAALSTFNNSGGTLTAPVAGTVAHIGGGASANAFFTTDAFNGIPGIYTQRANGTVGSKSAVQSGNIISGWFAGGYGATAYSSSGRASLRVLAAENWTDSAQGTTWNFFVTIPGGTTSANPLNISSVGVSVSGTAVVTSDVESTTVGAGFILKSPNGSRWRINVSDVGVITAVAL